MDDAGSAGGPRPAARCERGGPSAWPLPLLSVLGVLAVAAAGCGAPGGAAARGGGPDPETLRQPFSSPRHVVCDRLFLDLSPHFWPELTLPARSEEHRHGRDPGPPATYTFANERGGLAFPLRLAIGNLQATVLDRAVVRVHESGAARLDLLAEGEVALVDPEGTSHLSLETLSIRQGRVQAVPWGEKAGEKAPAGAGWGR